MIVRCAAAIIVLFRMHPGRERKGELVKKYVCNVCGWVYDPEVGDSDGGVAPGTAFEDVPDDWVCPACGAPKSEFSPQA